MKTILAVLALVMLLGLQGCASVTKGTKDTIQVNVSNCSSPMDCTATNKKGTWSFTAPGPVTFKKSDQDLIIVCNDGGASITTSLRPTRGGMIWGNLLIGGIIGGGLDAITDAHWNMADSLILHRDNCPGNNMAASYQQVQPTYQQRQSSSQQVQPTYQQRQSSGQQVQPTYQQRQSSSQQGQPTYQRTQPLNQPEQGNKTEGRTNHISASRLRAVNEQDKDDCDFITSITRGVGGSGNGDVSKYIEKVMNLVKVDAVDSGADSYFIVNTDVALHGASVTVEAFRCN